MLPSGRSTNGRLACCLPNRITSERRSPMNNTPRPSSRVLLVATGLTQMQGGPALIEAERLLLADPAPHVSREARNLGS